MKIIKFAIPFCLAAALSFGATWRGVKMLDASCYDANGKVQHIGSMCAPTATTTNFAFETRYGKIYKLDAVSNDKAEKAVKDGVLKANRYGDYRAEIRGKREGNGLVMVSAINHRSGSEQ